MLRFGPGVTLETLESFSVNKTLEEMKETLQRKEKTYWSIQVHCKANDIHNKNWEIGLTITRHEIGL